MADKIVKITGDQTVGGVSRLLDPTDKSLDMVLFQQGKPVLDSELNLAQNVQSQRHAQLIRDTHPSGFVNLSEMENNPSNLTQWRTKEEMVAYVNGYRVVIPAGTVMPVSAAPTTGAREDLIFLEVWLEELAPTANPENTLSTVKQHGNVDGTTLTNDLVDTNVNDETSRRVQVRYRIRNHENVDFETNPDGLRRPAGTWASGVVMGQGGASSPAATANNRDRFTSVRETSVMTSMRNWSRMDPSLYLAGDGTQACADLYKSVDGYVYALPMFRLRRRNTGDFSVQNPNGSRAWYLPNRDYTFPRTYAPGESITLALDTTDADRYRIGDFVASPTAPTQFAMKVTNKQGNNVTFLLVGTSSMAILNQRLAAGAVGEFTPGVAPDGVFNNVVAAQDVTDLRRLTDIRDVDFKTLMDRATHDFFRRDVFSKRLVKQYHGVPKTPIDANHLVYGSQDGVQAPERGTVLTEDTWVGYGATPTGLGRVIRDARMWRVAVPATTDITVEGWFEVANLYTVPAGNQWSYVMTLRDSTLTTVGTFYSDLVGNASRFVFRTQGSDATLIHHPVIIPKPVGDYMHLRWAFTKATNRLRVYANGVKVFDATNVLLRTEAITAVEVGTTSSGWGYLGAFSDFAVSNIDRGDVFATIPEDVRLGHAGVTYRFTEDRKAYSAAILSEAKTVYVSPTNPNALPYVKATQATAGVWAQNDTIKVIGQAHNVLTGLQDGDTANAMIMDVITGAGATSAVFETDTVTGIAVGDVFRVGPWETHLHTQVTVTAVDATKNWVTVSAASPFQSDMTVYNGKRLVEVTLASSPMTVTRWDGTNWVAVTTTQSGISTPEVIITLPAGIPADAQLKIDYTDVRYPDRDKAGLPEDVVALEVNGVIGNGDKVESVANFVGKIVGSLTANPHKYGHRVSTNISDAPSLFADNPYQLSTDRIAVLDGVTHDLTAYSNGEISKVLFSFNLIEHVQRTYGTIPGASVADKVGWLKANISLMSFNWWGQGSSVSSTKSSLGYWLNSTSWRTAQSWSSKSTSTAVIRIVFNTPALVAEAIANDGWFHAIAYADASDGTTTSVISTDYVELQVELKTGVIPDQVRGHRVLHTKGNYLEYVRETNLFRLGFTPKPTDVIASYALMRRETFREMNAPTVTVLAEADSVLVTDLVSAVGSKQGTHPWKNIADLVERDTVNAVGELGYGELPITADMKGANVGVGIQPHALALISGFTGQKTVRTPYQKKLISLMRYLVLHDGELKLLVVSDTVWGGTVDLAYGYSFLIPLMERRVMHPGMSVGTRSRSTIYPKAWLDAPKFLNQ